LKNASGALVGLAVFSGRIGFSAEGTVCVAGVCCPRMTYENERTMASRKRQRTGRRNKDIAEHCKRHPKELTRCDRIRASLRSPMIFSLKIFRPFLHSFCLLVICSSALRCEGQTPKSPARQQVKSLTTEAERLYRDSVQALQQGDLNKARNG